MDFNEIDQLVHQFKGSSASFGARRMADLCIHMREACQARDTAACQALLQQVAEQFRVRRPRPDTHMFTNARVHTRPRHRLQMASIMHVGQQASPANPGQNFARCLYLLTLCAWARRDLRPKFSSQARPSERTC